MEYTLLELDFIDFKVVELMFEKSVLYKHKRLKFEKKKKKQRTGTCELVQTTSEPAPQST